MTISFPGTFLLLIVLAGASCWLGCRENISLSSKPAEPQADSSTPKNIPKEDSSREPLPTQSVESQRGAEKTDAEPATNPGDAGQANNSESSSSVVAGNQSTGSSGQRQGLVKPAIPTSAANQPSSNNTRSVQPTFSLPRFESAEAALTYAKRQREKSSKLSSSGDTAAAYEEALQGWQALQSHLADKGCGSLSGDLLAELEIYGEKLGSKGISIIGKPLKIK